MEDITASSKETDVGYESFLANTATGNNLLWSDGKDQCEHCKGTGRHISTVEKYIINANIDPLLRYNHFFNAKEMAVIKKDLWTNVKFRPEQGQEKGVLHDKRRLYTFQGSYGFGYNNVWLPESEFTIGTLLIKQKLERTFQDFKCNGVMITVYPPSSEEVIKQAKEEDADRAGMGTHQDNNSHLEDKELIMVFACNFYINPKSPEEYTHVEGWRFVVFEDCEERGVHNAGKQLFAVDQNDGDLTIQPKGN